MKNQACDLILKNSSICLIKDQKLHFEEHDLCLANNKIVHIGSSLKWSSEEIIDCKGLSAFPGFIDSQVHFREPGLEHKEDLASGSLSAVKGGVTSVFEMPNTKPPTSNREALEYKLKAAQGRMRTNFAFYAGATLNNIDILPELEQIQGCCGTKIFMGSSTGDLLVDELQGLEKILSVLKRNVAVHSEDESSLKRRLPFQRPGDPASHADWRDAETAFTSTKNLIELAQKTKKRVHVLHVSTHQEMEFLKQHKNIASVEVTPQHLTFASPEVYERLGTLAQMNPPLRSEEHRRALWKGLNDGTVDVLGSDHAPHTLEEKTKEYPMTPSGMPGVQTILPVMLTHVNEGRLSLLRLVELMILKPVSLFNIKGKGRFDMGYDADISLVDLKKEWQIDSSWTNYKCGWSPFDGFRAKGLPVTTIVSGKVAYTEGEFPGQPSGQKIEFIDII